MLSLGYYDKNSEMEALDLKINIGTFNSNKTWVAVIYMLKHNHKRKYKDLNILRFRPVLIIQNPGETTAFYVSTIDEELFCNLT